MSSKFELFTNNMVVAVGIANLLNKNSSLPLKYTGNNILLDGAKYFVEIASQGVIGCIALIMENANMSKTFHLCVHPDFRRKGIARKLKIKAIENCQTPYIFCTIREDNIASMRLSLSLGYISVKKLCNYDHDVWVLGKRVEMRESRRRSEICRL